MSKKSSEATLHIYPPILQRARDMRHPLTPAEKKVWDRVRNHQLGYKIRRQHPLFRFISNNLIPIVNPPKTPSPLARSLHGLG